ncbi:MAG: hypothetical protein ABL995_01320 [Bryobacteraceae bacterium]
MNYALPSSGSFARRCSDASLFAILLWIALPEIWTRTLTVGPVPLHFFFTQMWWVALMAERFYRQTTPSKYFWLLMLAMTYTSACAVWQSGHNNWDVKYFVSDLWTMQVFVLGMLWARRRTLLQLTAFFRLLGGVLMPLAIGTAAGVYLGFIRPAGSEYSDRLYTSSLWNIACVAQFAWPIVGSVHAYSNRFAPGQRGIGNTYLRNCARLMIPVALFIAIFTATRSLLLVSAMVFAFIWAMERKRTSQQILIGTVVLLLFLTAGLTLASIIRVKGYSVLDRFAQADLASEGRLIELRWMFEQLGDDFLSGWGFGSLFYSTIRYQGRLFETAPHIGIATSLLKGGVFLALVFLVIPVVKCAIGLANRTPAAIAAAGCVLVYVVTACLSGGWYPFQTLLFGVGLGISYLRHRPVEVQTRVAPAVQTEAGVGGMR